MVDRLVSKIITPTLEDIAQSLPDKISADKLTIFGFVIGMMSVPLLWLNLYKIALIFILINRFFDGIDGAVARRNGITSFGGYLDITCDFIFYSAVILGFALSNPGNNSLAAVFLIFSFIGTGSSFLAFAVIAEKHDNIVNAQSHKAFYYMEGLAEGTETIIFYVIICLFPEYFNLAAVIFGILCWGTVIGRFFSAYFLLR